MLALRSSKGDGGVVICRFALQYALCLEQPFGDQIGISPEIV